MHELNMQNIDESHKYNFVQRKPNTKNTNGRILCI